MARNSRASRGFSSVNPEATLRVSGASRISVPSPRNLPAFPRGTPYTICQVIASQLIMILSGADQSRAKPDSRSMSSINTMMSGLHAPQASPARHASSTACVVVRLSRRIASMTARAVMPWQMHSTSSACSCQWLIPGDGGRPGIGISASSSCIDVHRSTANFLPRRMHSPIAECQTGETLTRAEGMAR